MARPGLSAVYGEVFFQKTATTEAPDGTVRVWNIRFAYSFRATAAVMAFPHFINYNGVSIALRSRLVKSFFEFLIFFYRIIEKI